MANPTQGVMPPGTGLDQRDGFVTYDTEKDGLTKKCRNCRAIKGLAAFKRKRGPQDNPTTDCLACRDANAANAV